MDNNTVREINSKNTEIHHMLEMIGFELTESKPNQELIALMVTRAKERTQAIHELTKES